MHHCFICFADVLLPELIKFTQAGLKELEMIRNIGGYLLCQYELLSVELLRHSFFHLLIGAIAHIDYKGGKTEKGAHSKNNKSTRSDISDFAQNALLMLRNGDETTSQLRESCFVPVPYKQKPVTYQ
jgi:hypothetical protein